MIACYLKSLIIFFLGLSCSYAEVKTGQQLSSFRLSDQHKVEHVIDTNVRLLIFARDMSGNKLIREALDGKTKEYLEKHKALYVSDISQMPKLITKLVAMPKMKKYSYPVLLDTEAELTKDLPYKEDHASLIYLTGLKVDKIEFISKSQDLKNKLGN